MTLNKALSKLIETGVAAVDKNAELLNEVSQQIWLHPELGYEEKFAHETLTTFLEKQGFAVSRKTPLETSFIAKAGDENGVKVGVLCEYDALPSIGHGCGHNLIAEAGLAAAIGLKAILDANPDIKAQVIAFGTPAEEGEGGKVDMIKKNCFDNVNFCMMVHPGPVNDLEFRTLAISQLSIVYHGKESHACSSPWLAINALDAAVQCYCNISMLRQQMLPSCSVHGVILDGGSKANVIPERSELFYFVRGADDKSRDDLWDKVVSCAKAAGEATGCNVEISSPGNPFSNMKYNQILNSLYKKYASSLGFDFPNFKELGASELDNGGSTDMGNVSQVTPSIHPIFKIGDIPYHTKEFADVARLPEAQIPTLASGKAMMMVAIEVIANPELLQSVKSEFTKDL